MNNTKIKILIPNATSPQNVGDAAILQSLLGLLQSSFDDPEIVIHSSEPHLHKINVSALRDTLYYWAVFKDPSVFNRVNRLILLCLAMVVWKLGLQKMVRFPQQLQLLFDDYISADYIVYVGGGSLRSRPGLSQSLNVVMTCLPFWFGSHSTAKTITAPISFGPFASDWQERFVGIFFKGLDVTSVREKFSYDLLKKYRDKVVRSEDSALLLTSDLSSKKSIQSTDSDSFVVGYTIRDWLEREPQKEFEKAYLTALIKFSRNKKVVFQPIAQVNAVKYGDIDVKLANKFSAGLQMAGAKVLPTVINQTVEQAQQVYSSLDLLVGMRMHSNILAATVGVPFVAISYEYKTDGLVESLGLENYCIKVEAVTAEKLLLILNDAYTNNFEMTKKMQSNLKRIRKQEIKLWKEIFKFN
jgi:colanic acid/amylovoran biosynthesis protein